MGSGDGVDPPTIRTWLNMNLEHGWRWSDPHPTHIHTQTQNQLRLDVYGAEDGSGNEFDPPISSGWTEVEPDMELIPLHVRLDICGTETGDGVSSEMVQYNYESGCGSGDGVDPPKN